jgi:hypothetical protein
MASDQGSAPKMPILNGQFRASIPRRSSSSAMVNM